MYRKRDWKEIYRVCCWFLGGPIMILKIFSMFRVFEVLTTLRSEKQVF